ncbi:unnamed protein product [Phytomonas sp. Hart1]|nr:unnamed protein product [Phytomonas sp. Hart1]|eukprot:CCW68020.1 unnamed protein product [Phytomonas sp. isolate Hart1]
MMLIHCNAVPKFVNLLGSQDADCRDQSAWAIGNLAGEGASCRDVALANGAMPALLRLLLDPSQPLNVLRNVTWAASNLCCGVSFCVMYSYIRLLCLPCSLLLGQKGL